MSAEVLGWADRLKIRMVMAGRAVSRASVERWSRTTFRHLRPRTATLPRVLAAPDKYKSQILPRALVVPDAIPSEVRLGMSYVFPYYILSGIEFTIIEYLPFDHRVAWTPDEPFNALFRPHPEGWDDILADDAFTALRLQGANPFLLTRDPQREGRFLVDYGPYFEGVVGPVVCAFVLKDGRLVPESIAMDKETHQPGGPGWERAKLIANALDARFTVFLRHLEHTHLITAQAYSLSAFALPPAHGLRAFLELFTYSTLSVNDFAFRLLVTPESYFISSHFLDAKHVQRLFANFLPTYRLEQLVPKKDIAARGIDQIPNHPYVQDAPEIWDVLEAFTRSYLAKLYADEAALKADAAAAHWYEKLVSWLPNRSLTEHPLTLGSLTETLTALVYLNASHEIAGDFSVYTMSQDPQQKRLVDFDNLLAESPRPASAGDVFLFDQGAWAGRFDNGGNFLVAMDLDACVPDPPLRDCMRKLQADLSALDDRLKMRNAARKIPFLRLQPRKWKASISF